MAPTRPFKGLIDTHLECRTFGHQWEDVTGIDLGDEYMLKYTYKSGKRVTLRCVRCGMVRHECWLLGSVGTLLARHYSQPKGYSVVKWDGKGTTREKARAEYLARK